MWPCCHQAPPRPLTPECLRGWVSWPRLLRVPQQPPQVSQAPNSAPHSDGTPPGPSHPPPPLPPPTLSALPGRQQRPSGVSWATGTAPHIPWPGTTHIDPLPGLEARSLMVNPSPTLPGAVAGPPHPLPRAVRGGGSTSQPPPLLASPLSRTGALLERAMGAGRDSRASLRAGVPEAFGSPSTPPSCPRLHTGRQCGGPRGRLCLDQGFGKGGGCSHVLGLSLLKPLACAREEGFCPCSRSRS